MVDIRKLATDFSSDQGFFQGNYSIASGSMTVGNVAGDVASSRGYYSIIGSQIVFDVTQLADSTSSYIAIKRASDNDTFPLAYFRKSGTNLTLSHVISPGSGSIGISLTYNASTHRFIRIREDSGTMYFDTSPDNVTYTQRDSFTPFGTLTDVRVVMRHDISSSGGSSTIVSSINIDDIPIDTYCTNITTSVNLEEMTL